MLSICLIYTKFAIIEEFQPEQNILQMRNPKPDTEHRGSRDKNDAGAVLARSVRGVRRPGHHRPRVVRQEALPRKDRETPRRRSRQMRKT